MAQGVSGMPFVLLWAPAAWPARQTNWEAVHRTVGRLKSQLLPAGPEGLPWEPGSVAKGAGSKRFRMSVTTGDDLSSCSACKGTELGPPTVSSSALSVCSQAQRSLRIFPALAKAAWQWFLGRRAELPGAVLEN